MSHVFMFSQHSKFLPLLRRLHAVLDRVARHVFRVHFLPRALDDFGFDFPRHDHDAVVVRTRSGFDEHGNVALSRLEVAGNIEGGDATLTETRIHPDDPSRARTSMLQRTELGRGAWRVSIETDIQIACTKTEFIVAARLDAWEGDASVFHRTWDERVPRLGL